MRMMLAILTSIYLLVGLAIASQAQSNSKENIASETMQYVSEGSAAYLRHDYKKAIHFYSKALSLEKKKPTLEKDIWRVLVDNLGMSYGISGNNNKAKEIFEYGLSKDDKYPMFYYNLACAYAEMKDLDNAIVNLKRAFEYKQNMIPGEEMPNPETDGSFSRYLKSEKFRRALEELNSK
jgi:tetratricopeptide (TPR) repeat protein